MIDPQLVRIDPNDPNDILRMILLQRVLNKGHMDQKEKGRNYAVFYNIKS